MNSAGPLPCPDCGAPLPGPRAACPSCGLPLTGPAATELWQLDTALNALRAQEGHLLARRDVLLTTLRSARDRAAEGAATGVAAGAAKGEVPAGVAAGPWQQAPAGPGPLGSGPTGSGPVGSVPGGSGRGPDMSGRAVQNLLLSLGGLLLVVAAIVFTVVSWGQLGIEGRAAVLLGFTGVTLAVPPYLAGRKLTATAETVAILGLALLFLDGYAAYEFGLAGLDRIDSQHYTAGLIAVVSVIFAIYGHVTRLKSPVPMAIVLAQFPLLVLALDTTALWVTAALVATAALDAVIWTWGRRATATACFAVTWTLGAAFGVLTSAVQSLGFPDSFTLSVLLVAATALALYLAIRTRWTTPAAAGAAITLAAAVAYPVRMAISEEWWIVPTPLAAFLVAAVALEMRRKRLAVEGASAGVLERICQVAAVTAGIFGLLVAAPVAVPVAVALTGPFDQGAVVWGGAGGRGFRDLLGSVLVSPKPPVLVVLAAVALALAGLAYRVRRQRDPLLLAGAAVAAVLVAVVPVTWNLPFGAGVAVLVAVPVALGIGAIFAGGLRERVLGLLAVAAIAEVAAWALVSEPATLAATGVLAVTAAVVAWRATTPEVPVWAAGVATALAGGEAVAAWLAADLDARYVTFVLLATAAVAAALAWRMPRRGLGVEIAGYGLAVTGIGLSADARMLSVALAVAGVIAVGTALRTDRRKAAYAGTALLLLASWVRLSAENVTVVEAYTVPVSAVLLAFGWFRAREGSSWVAYGSGLSFSLIPSVFALYGNVYPSGGAGWLRPLGLGLAALVILLAGARWRLQAPALLGGFTLAAVAVHELAPYVSELMVSVPRWVPMAFGGLLLLVVGATYEARLRDLRRLTSTIKGLR
ncbi:SCO7613 C-terminal domain-containing membrane protein [Acrocarpospora catenulata]|uniref:SCO7613 C-terminal domain-containing membrane protein n=1 Tax=Acrocarpospora catenulata TaxID=2836182 RepID=UPI001BD9F5FB|nr:hypothetical protein [Acrocarpospora catenulata]